MNDIEKLNINADLIKDWQEYKIVNKEVFLFDTVQSELLCSLEDKDLKIAVYLEKVEDMVKVTASKLIHNYFITNSYRYFKLQVNLEHSQVSFSYLTQADIFRELNSFYTGNIPPNLLEKLYITHG